MASEQSEFKNCNLMPYRYCMKPIQSTEQ